MNVSQYCKVSYGSAAMVQRHLTFKLRVKGKRVPYVTQTVGGPCVGGRTETSGVGRRIRFDKDSYSSREVGR